MIIQRSQIHDKSGFLQLWSLGDGINTHNATVVSEDALAGWFRGVRRHGSAASNQTLRILHVNDTHHFHLGATPADMRGQAHEKTPIGALAAIIDEKRLETQREGVDLLYLSSGDEHTGTSLDELLGYTGEEFKQSAAYALQSDIGLDAAVLGNHDLDRGSEILERAIRSNAAFPVLSANIEASRFLSSYHSALIGETVRGIAVGIVGVTTDEQLQVRASLDPQFSIGDPVKAARRWYRALAPAVDILILLSHLGLNVDGSRHQSQRDDRLLAATLAEEERRTPAPNRPLTMILGGHTHTVIDPSSAPVVVDGISIFQAGCNMAYLGEVTVDLKRGGLDGKLINIREHQPASAVREPLPRATRLLNSLSQRVLTPVATVSSAVDADTGVTLEARLSGECAVANMITDTIQQWYASEEENTLVVAIDATGIHAGLTDAQARGAPLRVDDFYRILPYADSLYRAVLTAEELRKIVDSNSRRILRRNELEGRGGKIGLMDWSQIARGYLHFSGNLRYRLVHDTRGRRASDITVNDAPIEAFGTDHRITVYCNSFSAMGNQGWAPGSDTSFAEFGAVSLPALGFTDTGIPLRLALIEALRANSPTTVGRDGRLVVDTAPIEATRGK